MLSKRKLFWGPIMTRPNLLHDFHCNMWHWPIKPCE